MQPQQARAPSHQLPFVLDLCDETLGPSPVPTGGGIYRLLGLPRPAIVLQL